MTLHISDILSPSVVERRGYVVVDKDGDTTELTTNLEEARQTAVQYDGLYRNVRPHRVVEVLWREVKP
jgi:hypothetical protein